MSFCNVVILVQIKMFPSSYTLTLNKWSASTGILLNNIVLIDNTNKMDTQ